MHLDRLFLRKVLHPLWVLATFCIVGGIPSAQQDANHAAYGRIPMAPYFGGVVLKGVVGSAALDEASGLAASRRHPGLLYSHNDSGDSARVFVLDSNGRHRGMLWLQGARNRDWEEVALGAGPEPGQDYLYCADVGDNLAHRDSITIYRLPEPDPATYNGTQELRITQYDKIVIRYKDGPRDCEAILVEPATRNLYLITKRDKRSRLYVVKYPQRTDGIANIAQGFFEFPFAQVTAASSLVSSPHGTEILVRTYGGIFYWQGPKDVGYDSLLRQPPVQLPYWREVQGEAICLAPDGSGYYTLSEKSNEPVSRLLFHYRK